MSQSSAHTDRLGDTADDHAAAAVIEHHRQLADELAAHTGRLHVAVTGDDVQRIWRARDVLLGFLRTELVPHAEAEEAVLYPAAAAQPAGRLLVDGMLAEHRAITALVTELADAGTPVAAAAAARALSALFEVHLAKENDLILPLLAAEHVSLAGLLDGMHELLGAGQAAGG